MTLEQTGIILKEGSMRLKDAVEAFLRYTDKPMVSSREAVTAGLVQACADGLVGIGRCGSPTTLQARYCKAAVTLDPNEDGVWVIPAFAPEAPTPAAARAPAGPPGSGAADATTTTPAKPGAPTAEAKGKRAVRRFVVSGAVLVENYGEVFRCFVGPAARMNLKRLRLGVQFEMETAEGQELDENDPDLKAMREAAGQLGLKIDIEA